MGTRLRHVEYQKRFQPQLATRSPLSPLSHTRPPAAENHQKRRDEQLFERWTSSSPSCSPLADDVAPLPSRTSSSRCLCLLESIAWRSEQAWFLCPASQAHSVGGQVQVAGRSSKRGDTLNGNQESREVSIIGWSINSPLHHLLLLAPNQPLVLPVARQRPSATTGRQTSSPRLRWRQTRSANPRLGRQDR